MDAIEVYDNKRSKQMTWIIPLLMNAMNLGDFLANKIMMTISYSYIPLRVGYHCYYTSPRRSRG